MFAKMSLRNAQRQLKDYLIYITTILISVALIYAFNGIVFSDKVQKLSSLLELLPLMLILTSIVVVLIIAWLVFYVLRFMLKKRSKEFGTYLLLGIERKDILKMFYQENLCVAIGSLLMGIVLGNVLYQGFSAILLNMFDETYQFNFTFSLPAILLTILYFGVIFIVALLLNQRKLKKGTIRDLVEANQRNENGLVNKGGRRKGVFTISMICGFCGMVLLLSHKAVLGAVGAVLLIIFIFTFYFSFSSGLVAHYNKHLKNKYRYNTLFVFRSLSSKVASMGITMSAITILLTVTLVAIGAGLVFNHSFKRTVKLCTNFDVFIGSNDANSNLEEYSEYIATNIDVEESCKYQAYDANNSRLTTFINNNADYYKQSDNDIVMKYSDYIKLREILGYQPINALADDGFIIHCMDYLEKPFQTYSETYLINKKVLKKQNVYSESFTQQLWIGNGDGFVIIVPDDVAKPLNTIRSMFVAKTKYPITMDDYIALLDIADKKSGESSNMEMDSIFSKAIVREQTMSNSALIIFPLFYLALIMLIVSATILAVQILSEMESFKRQYAILHKLGADRYYMISSLRKQFSTYYLLPVIPAIIISTILIVYLCNEFDSGVFVDALQVISIIGETTAIFLIIYLLNVIVSYVSVKKNIIPL